MGFIDAEQVEKLTRPLRGNGYATYLLDVLNDLGHGPAVRQVE
jgi:hypothetical protein